MALGMGKDIKEQSGDFSESDKSIGDYLQQNSGQKKANERKPMCDIVQGLKDNYGSSDSESQSEKYQRVEMGEDIIE